MKDKPELLRQLNHETLHDHVLPYLDIGSLRQLSLSCRTFADLAASHLAHAACLVLTEKQRKTIKERHLISIAEKTRNLKYLDLSLCSDAVTNTSLKRLIYQNHGIRLLNISGCYKITAQAFAIEEDILENKSALYALSNLEIFIANWCRMVNGEVIVSMSHAPLRVLSLAGTWYIDDEAVLDCVTFFSNLECLNLSKCYKVTDRSVSQLVYCTKLRVLKISSCWRVSDGAVNLVVEACGALAQVALDDCRSVTRALLGSLSDKGILLLEGGKKDVEQRWDCSKSYMDDNFRF